MSTVEDAPGTAAPDQRIEIIGEATPEQVAALVAVLSGLGSGEEPDGHPSSRWADHGRLVRRSVHAGPGGWRASALPR